MIKYFYIGLFSITSVCCNVGSRHSQREKSDGINKLDSKGNQHGFWKIMLPDEYGHYRNFFEGFFNHGRMVGVWNFKKGDAKLVHREIYFDTSEKEVMRINFDMKGQIESEGYLQSVVLFDTLDVYDYTTNSVKKIFHRKIYEMNGPWKFFWENGNVRMAGLFKNDFKIGYWKYFDENGQLIKDSLFRGE